MERQDLESSELLSASQDGGGGEDGEVNIDSFTGTGTEVLEEQHHGRDYIQPAQSVVFCTIDEQFDEYHHQVPL